MKLGQVVIYTLSDMDAQQINRRREDARKSRIALDHTGAMVHGGNGVLAGDEFPLVITRLWGDTDDSCVNGQVLLDGFDTLWVTSVHQGDGERKFRVA